VADKFGYVCLDGVTYSTPIVLAYRSVVCRMFHDRIEMGHEGGVVATHVRSFGAAPARAGPGLRPGDAGGEAVRVAGVCGRRRARRSPGDYDAEVRRKAVEAYLSAGIAPQEVHAEVVRDVGSGTVFVIRGGPPATGLDVVRALVRAARAAGRWPLVFVSDNGPPYWSRVLARFLAALRIVHLRNEPRTPQHNAWSERGMRELKATAHLAARPPARRLAAFARAAAQLNRGPRLTKDNLTALELRHSMRPATALVDREIFYRAAGAAMTAAVRPQAKGRARRRAERAAIFTTLEQFDLIIMYRGGVRVTPRVAETIT
jgi:hypothetical protein